MTEDVLISTEDAVGRIRLNRPKAIHALTTGMCQVMSEALLRWQSDPSIELVIIDHAEGRGFCAGGDVVMLARSGSEDAEDAKHFFFAEYRLNHLLFTYAKPTIALMDGITMGGGVGISLPCDYRIATASTRLAMPETGIGLFPDVGGGWYLSRLPGRVGQYMALTGARLDGADCHYLQLATHFVEQAAIPDLVERLVKSPTRAAGAVGAAAVKPPEPKIEANLPAISKLFASDRLEDILAALEADDGDWANSELATLKSKSPLSCKVSLRLLAEGATRANFSEEMRAEYALAGRVVRTHDFREGVRALLIDKDGAPNWSPPTPEAISDADIDKFFEPLPEDEAWTPYSQESAA